LRRCDCKPWLIHADGCPEAGVKLILVSQPLIDERNSSRAQAQDDGPDDSQSDSALSSDDNGKNKRRKSPPSNAAWVGCTNLEKEYKPHEGDAWISTTELSYEVFVGDGPEWKVSHRQAFIDQ